MSLPRYPSYKDSGVEWLGEVPGHWEVKKLKQSCHVFPSNVDKKSYEDEMPTLLCNYTDVYYKETITKNMNFMAATASADQIAKFTLRAGDTIITKDSETADDIAIAAYVPEDLPGIVCGYHLSMVRPFPGTRGAFVKRLFDSTYAKSCFAIRANGLTRVGLGQYELDNVELPFPPLTEQTQIAAFLDRETAKIDELVAEQRRLMELLKEKRQAVISHAVTRGLNPDAPLKPSGIEWLGDVPEHWEVQRYKNALTIFQGMAFKSGDYVDSSSTVSIRMGNIKKGGFINLEHNTKYLPDSFSETFSEYSLHENDLIIAMTDMSPSLEFLAVPAIMKNLDPSCTYLLNQRVGKLSVNNRFHAEYVKYLLLSDSLREQLKFLGLGTVQSNMSSENLYCAFLTAPPMEEQAAIARALDLATRNFDTLTTEAQRAIDLLQERRTALISAAVTGQIDVRGAVAA